MKKLLIFLGILFLISGCGESNEKLTCTTTSSANGMTTDTKYEIEYVDDEVKYVTITYDYKQDTTNYTTDTDDTDGVDADSDGTTDDDTDGTLDSDDVVDGVVGDAIDDAIDGVTDTILDLAGIKDTYENQMSSYDNIEGFSYTVDTDDDNEYKVVYKIDLDKISDSDLTRFNVDRDFSTTRANYEDAGYTCS